MVIQTSHGNNNMALSPNFAQNISKAPKVPLFEDDRTEDGDMQTSNNDDDHSFRDTQPVIQRLLSGHHQHKTIDEEQK